MQLVIRSMQRWVRSTAGLVAAAAPGKIRAVYCVEVVRRFTQELLETMVLLLLLKRRPSVM
jgi:hypothetical protein